MAAAARFSHIGTAHDCSERRDTSKNVLVPKSAKQMELEQALRGRRTGRSLYPAPLEMAASRRRGEGLRGARSLAGSRFCLCSVYGPSVIH